MTENNHLEEQTQKQKEHIANTIATKKGISLFVGLKELGRAIGVGTKKTTPAKHNGNPYQISENLETIEKKIIVKKQPLINN